MRGVVYVLDEPTAGLHPQDHHRLLETLAGVRDAGNTLVLVEHEASMIRAADWILELGEGAGTHGGSVLFQGPPSALDGTLTGRFLRGELRPATPAKRRSPSGEITLIGARANNLRNLTVRIPLGVLTAVTGVSGSGKSSLVEETLYRALARRLHGARLDAGPHDALAGAEGIDKVIAIDQAPIGRTPRSNPASYTGALSSIRELMSLLPEACARGYRPGRFSFNIKGGRCESCQGDGVRTLAMQFLPDAYVVCETCGGQRYNRETLEVRYRGRNIADILSLTVAEALPLFAHHPRLRRIFTTLADVGLAYLTLGQNAATLSGGEAQRVKLARELARRDTGRTLYILDEPTTGLHADDTRRLLGVLSRLLIAGNTVLLVEHNLDVIRFADHIIDLGPGAGPEGGRIVAQGTPDHIARVRRSATGRCLSKQPESHTRCGPEATVQPGHCAFAATPPEQD
jgi:excinuclease ABC subunit A